MPIVVVILGVLVSVVLRHIVSLLAMMGKPNAGIVKDLSFQPTVTVICPVFNEGEAVYLTIESIAQSNYPNDKVELIAIDDCSSDDSYQWLLKAQQDFTNIRIRVDKNARNLGKARTQSVALRRCDAEVILCIDSDAIFAPDAIRELAACFVDPKIGAVGGVVGVRNSNQNVLTSCQSMIYAENFQLLKISENWTQSVICLSGCMLAIRRELFVKIEPSIAARNFCGLAVKDGEDRFLTHMVQLEGYGTVINPKARCLTRVPDTLGSLWNQQIRWQRSGIRDFALTMRTLHEHIWKLPANPNLLYGLVCPTLAALVSIFMILVVPFDHVVFAVSTYWVGFCVVLACLYQLLMRRYWPEQKLTASWRLIGLAAYAGWGVVGRLIEICALCTLDSTSWMTREQPSDAMPVPEVAVAYAGAERA